MTDPSDSTTEVQHDGEEIASLLEDVTDHAAVPEELGTLVSTVVEQNRRLAEQNRQLRERVADLEEDLEQTHDVATAAVGTAQANESRVEDLEETSEQTREISKCAIAKAEQADTAVHDDGSQEDAEALPGGIEPSTSPLDFFANCRPEKVREIFVEQSNRTNTYRAIEIAKRWDEFATRRHDGTAIAWTRDDVETALTAHLGKSPHRQTVSRVYEKLAELGGSDLVEKRHRVGPSQDPKTILKMDVEAARDLQDGRYHGLDLLEESDHTATTGGVTPVVTHGSTPAL